MTAFVPALTLPAAVFAQPAAAILLPVVAGAGIGYLTRPQTDSTYDKLKQPPGRPPAWVFGPVWTLLYAGMGYASYRAWSAGMSSPDPITTDLAKQGATLYTVQLGLNLVWMPLFFGFGRPLEATVDIVALTGVVGYLTHTWSQVDETSAWIMAPYLAWLSFATYLSAGFGYLNNWSTKTDKTDKAE
ncbi:putative translocator protein [Neofusicoccum parvum UCRNP2]|uniref:Putative translocator protein n=1 Tax=Botryosphaeria parva (strain UCR-NP2) TaxID=1287680 RepID=R1GP29_BOTPV|nr:putative translocator protein [Neofusicoccum parvum UCRNP2]